MSYQARTIRLTAEAWAKLDRIIAARAARRWSRSDQIEEWIMEAAEPDAPPRSTPPPPAPRPGSADDFWDEEGNNND